MKLKAYKPFWEEDEWKEIELPKENSEWDDIARFALTFNGYVYAGGIEKSDELWDKTAANIDGATIDDLRACLFLLQRAGRFCGDEGSAYDLEQGREIIELIREKMKNE